MVKENNKYKQVNTTPNRFMKVKLYSFVCGAFLIFAILIVSKLYSISITNSEYYRTKANNQQLNTFELNANRGAVYDRNGKILAKSSTVWTVILSPYDISQNDKCKKELCENCPGKNCRARIERICKMLSEILDVNYEKLVGICEDPNNRYEIIKRKVDKETHDKINTEKKENEIGFYSVYLIEDTIRAYPNKSTASNLIGHTNYDNIGIYGVESYYDNYLQGRNGKLVMLKDAVGRTMPSEYEQRFDAIDGNNLHMTVDIVLQHYLEKNLDIIVNQHNVGNRATGIMMEPNTGAILAMATASGYDLNNPTELPEKDEQSLKLLEQELTQEAILEHGTLSDEIKKEIEDQVQNERAKLWELQWKNKAISELYFPGSVFKPITVASALEEKEISLQSGFHCGGFKIIEGENIGCWKRYGHGPLNLVEAVTHSCNPALMDMGSKLGIQRFYNYFEAFGFTEKTGIDLPAEAEPYVVPRSRMSTVDLAVSTFGQTNKITPLHMITAFAACINGGYLVTPHVVDKITDNDGNVIKTNDSGIKRQILSEETSETMRYILEEVVSFNGGNNAYMPGYKIGGKSGTSEKNDDERYINGEFMRYVASFCAFAPADNPKVIMLVAVDEPNPGGEPYYGSLVAAPVVSAVFKESFQHLEIYPQFTAEEQQKQDTITPYIVGKTPIDAKAKLHAAGLDANVIGNGAKVIRTVPGTGSPIRKGSTVVIYTEEQNNLQTKVPEVVGMSVAQVIKAFANADLNIRLSGGATDNENAKAMNTGVESGTTVDIGTIIDVQFAVDEGYGG